MRFRIALATAIAVFSVPLFLFGISGGSPAASAPGTRHTAASQERPRKVGMKLMSYDQEAKLVEFANAVEANQLKNYLQLAAFLEAVAKSENTIPAAWMPTAICEEGGRDDPTAGYFGIREWNGFDGYPTAGSAPLSVQLAWEARYIGGPPDAPGQCHSY
ncbi:MAG TPA: hypothetical protein VG346_07440 [Acidimicrobiales bacterium]|jgi:hypothetical protein|nr:hypothetical protein [Acidimicrobiales bacterium]